MNYASDVARRKRQEDKQTPYYYFLKKNNFFLHIKGGLNKAYIEK